MKKARIAIHWFRRDLRLHDNHGLYRALTEHGDVLPLFIFDTNILHKLATKKDRRVDFIHRAVQGLQQELVKVGSTIGVLPPPASTSSTASVVLGEKLRTALSQVPRT